MSNSAYASARFGSAPPDRDDRRVLPMETGECDDATARPHPQIARIQREEWLASVDELVAECERLRLMVRARNSCRVREAADQLAADCYGLRTTVRAPCNCHSRQETVSEARQVYIHNIREYAVCQAQTRFYFRCR